MGKGPVMPCHGSLGFVLSFGMRLNVINQGPFHPAKAVSHFCGFWLLAQWQALATPPLPRGFKVTFRAFQLQGSFFTWLPTLPFLLEILFLSKLKSIRKMLNFINTFFSWKEKFGLRSCTTPEFSDASQGHDSSRHKGNSSFGYYLCF